MLVCMWVLEHVCVCLYLAVHICIFMLGMASNQGDKHSSAVKCFEQQHQSAQLFAPPHSPSITVTT